MFKMRKNVFETNSSSTHAVAVVKDGDKKGLSLLFDENNCIKIDNADDLSFQWEFRVLDTQYEKLCYAIASYGYGNFDKVLSEVKKINENASILLPTSEDEYYNENDGLCYGDIDHQSEGTLQNYLEKTNSSISEFIMDPNVIVIIDNDNEDSIDTSILPYVTEKWYYA